MCGPSSSSHGGAIVYERYSPNPADGPDEVMPSYSMAKSVTSAMIGILVRDGRLDIDEPAAVPEWHEDPDDPRAAITVRHMLHMATGIPWDDGYLDEGSEMYEMVRSDDAAAYAAALLPTAAPGERFDYSSGTTTLLARIIGEEVGDSPADTRAFLDDELFDELGMAPVDTEFDEAGTWQGAYSADTTHGTTPSSGSSTSVAASGTASRSSPRTGWTSPERRALPTGSTAPSSGSTRPGRRCPTPSGSSAT